MHQVRLTLTEAVQGPVVLALRPEIVRVDAVGDSGRTDSRITAVEPMGREVLYTADGVFGTIRFLEAGAEPRHTEGDTVALGFPPSSALLFDKASGRRLGARVAV